MRYIVDANVLISAHSDYYPLDRIPQFWEWLLVQGRQGNIKILQEIRNEVTRDNPLNKWLKQDSVKNDLLIAGGNLGAEMLHVIDKGYEIPEVNEIDIKAMGRDPLLIAYAYANKCCVVSDEVSAPAKQGKNRKVPDVCKRLRVDCCNGFGLYRALRFSI